MARAHLRAQERHWISFNWCVRAWSAWSWRHHACAGTWGPMELVRFGPNMGRTGIRNYRNSRRIRSGWVKPNMSARVRTQLTRTGRSSKPGWPGLFELVTRRTQNGLPHRSKWHVWSTWIEPNERKSGHWIKTFHMSPACHPDLSSCHISFPATPSVRCHLPARKTNIPATSAKVLDLPRQQPHQHVTDSITLAFSQHFHVDRIANSTTSAFSQYLVASASHIN